MVVLPGVTIGNGAVIGAGSVVTKDVKPYEVVAGSPAENINWRFDEDIREFLLTLKWWNKDIEELKKHKDFFKKEINFKDSKSLENIWKKSDD